MEKFAKMLKKHPFAGQITQHSYPPDSEASREVANFIERNNPHTPVYGVKEFV